MSSYAQRAVLTAAQRIAVQPPQAHRNNCQNTNDLAREAVGWNFHDRTRSLLTRETVTPSTVSQKRRVGPPPFAGRRYRFFVPSA
jgi:hypothetical protein